MVLDAARLLLFPAIMAFAATSDLFTMTISNRVSLALTVVFFALALVMGLDATEVAWHVAAGVTVLAITFVFFTRGWVGGGDAKLAAVTALWLGFDHLLAYAVYASLFGGVLTVVVVYFRMQTFPAVLAGQQWLERLHRPEAGVPYGIALAAAALVVYPDTVWMKALSF
jgi:prepilin peptidase CpaA